MAACCPAARSLLAIGVTTQTITVNVAGDTSVESDETFDVVISNPLPDGAINVGTATATIVNDDNGITITADQSSKAEGNSGATPFTFTVTRTGLLTGTADVNWSATGSPTNGADTIDFVGGAPFPSGTLHFAANDVTKTITVNVQGDTTFEANEGFTVTLDSPVGTQILGANLGVVSSTILNDDFQALSAGDVAITGINGTNPDQFMFVPLVDLQPNASIIFTDDAWDGTALRTNEGAITYTAPAGGLPKGSVVEIQVATNGDPSVVVGNGTAAASGAGTFSLVSGGENILAYIGLSTAPTFLFAVTTDDSYLTTGSPSTSETYLPPGLVVGTSAVAPLDTAPLTRHPTWPTRSTTPAMALPAAPTNCEPSLRTPPIGTLIRPPTQRVSIRSRSTPPITPSPRQPPRATTTTTTSWMRPTTRSGVITWANMSPPSAMPMAAATESSTRPTTRSG